MSAKVQNTQTSLGFNDWMASGLSRTEVMLKQILPSCVGPQAQLHEAMRYAVLEGGKRIRPLLTYAAAELVGADPQVAARAGAAVELIHAYSLVHDDLPCMDNDVLRRGKPTVHIAFGEANAMLVGDSLQPLAFAAIAQLNDSLPSESVVNMVALLAQASGSEGMAGGQAIDLSMVGQTITRPQLEQMHRLKTGALLRCAILMGVWCGQKTPDAHLINAMDGYSRALGLAFQVVDDILDVSADTATLGKTAGKDEQANKPTYVSLLGLDAARKLANDLHDQALDYLASVETDVNWIKTRPDTQALRALADVVISRRS